MADTEDRDIDADHPGNRTAEIARPIEYAAVQAQPPPRLLIAVAWNTLGYEIGLGAYLANRLLRGSIGTSTPALLVDIGELTVLNAAGFMAAMMLIRDRAGGRLRSLYATTAIAGLVCGGGIHTSYRVFLRMLFPPHRAFAARLPMVVINASMFYLTPVLSSFFAAALLFLILLAFAGRSRRTN